MASFLSLPLELRCEVYAYMSTNGNWPDQVGLLLSCKRVYHEAKNEILRRRHAFFKKWETRINAPLPQPISVVMPSNFFDLERVTLDLSKELLALFETIPNTLGEKQAVVANYVRLIDRIIFVGHMRFGFTRPCKREDISITAAKAGRKMSKRFSGEHGLSGPDLYAAFHYCRHRKRYSWTLNVSPKIQGTGYLVEFVGVKK